MKGHEAIIFAGAWALATLAGLLLTPWVIAHALRWGLVDLPNRRKVHQTPTPRVGGLAVAGAAFVAAALAVARSTGHAPDFEAGPVLTLAVASAFVMLIGFVDDFLEIRAKFKLLALLAASAAVCGAGVRINAILLHGMQPVPLHWAAWPLTMLWIVGVTVSLNFIDGLDGLAGGIGVVACGVIALAAGCTGQPTVVILALSLLGALIGFLRYNVSPARVFMGDCGSMFLGFSLSTLSVLGHAKAGTTLGLALPAVALSIPLFDAALTLVRRGVIDRRSLFSAERGHIHHRLLDLGLCHAHATLVLWGFSILAAAVGWVALYSSGWATLAGLSLLAPLLLGFFTLSGSARLRETIAAVRRNRGLAREADHSRRAFDELQLRFRTADTLGGWWADVCAAAEMLDFQSVSLSLPRRDGSMHHLNWERPAEEPPRRVDLMQATIPIRQRRGGGPVEAAVVARAPSTLESAAGRLGLFARLVDEHSIAELPLDASPGPRKIQVSLTRLRLRSLWRKGTSGGVKMLKIDEKTLPPLTMDEPDAAMPAGLRVAVVHDFLYCYAGAERVLEQILAAFPQADLFSLFDFLPEGQRDFIGDRTVTTSFIQRLPLARTKHRAYLPLMPLAIEQLDVSDYDVVISSSYLAAKGVITRPDQLHVCYCHTPVRFAWDMQSQYLAGGRFGMVRNLLARMVLHYIRNWDSRSANGVDVFVTNSNFVARRIEKVYRRGATTIYPPVDVERFTAQERKEDFYLTASRLVPYKRIDLIVEAFNRMPSRRLIVVGEGPELARLKAMAGENVRVVGHQPVEKLRSYMQWAKGFVFAAEEDFGIVPVEAQACGTPVIAFGKGGVLESVIDGRTGMFFRQQTPESLIDAIDEFERREWSADVIRRNAERFSIERFQHHFASLIKQEWLAFQADRSIGRRPAARGVPWNGASVILATSDDAADGIRPIERMPVVVSGGGA